MAKILLIINNDEYWSKDQLPHVTMGNPNKVVKFYKI
jgi:hypothetical protein